MANVLIILADGCEEIEAVTVIDLLRRANINVTSTSLTNTLEVIASRQVKLIADTLLNQLDATQFDMIVLPGGLPGTTHLDNDPRIHNLLKQFNDANKFIAAICAAPIVLAHANLLTDRQVSSYPGVLDSKQWPGITLSHNAVSIDDNIITSRGPGTAIDFALTLIEILTDSSTRQQVESDLVRS